jgi:hypothetical protein
MSAVIGDHYGARDLGHLRKSFAHHRNGTRGFLLRVRVENANHQVGAAQALDLS